MLSYWELIKIAGLNNLLGARHYESMGRIIFPADKNTFTRLHSDLMFLKCYVCRNDII